MHLAEDAEKRNGGFPESQQRPHVRGPLELSVEKPLKHGIIEMSKHRIIETVQEYLGTAVQIEMGKWETWPSVQVFNVL